MGTGESQLASRIEDLELDWSKRGIKLAYLPSPGSVRIRLTAEADAVADLPSAHHLLVERLTEFLVSETGETVEEALAELWRNHGWTLAVAESCTGGGLGATLVSRPGASAFFLGGVQSYSNSAKVDLLGVPAAMIERHGAVSHPVACAMAEGARARLNADFGIGITGIAGPDGGSDEKPVGTVFIACSGPSGTHCESHRFGRDRTRNLGMTIRAACRLALEEGRNNSAVSNSGAKGVADSL